VDSGITQPGWIRDWAERIDQLRLSPIVLPIIEVGKAFRIVGANSLLVLRPLLEGIVADVTLDRTAALFEQGGVLEGLEELLSGGGE
jgi:hypothetical protein